MADMVDTVIDRLVGDLAGCRVAGVRMQIGEHAGVAMEALRFCFDVCTQGTALEDATLDIVATAGSELRLLALEVQ
jgi:hydrogenase nickel incorporation protein HypA/HybF